MRRSLVSEEYLRDESRYCGEAENIFFPRSEEEVAKVLRGCRRQGIPLTTQGGRTGIAGGAVPLGGYILNMERMNRIGRPQGDRLSVEPGARLTEIRQRLEGSGLTFVPDPTETTASIGGMAACNASGAKSFRYGSTRNYIEAMDVLLAGGEKLALRRGETRARGLEFRLRTQEGREILGRLPSYVMPQVKNAAGYYVKPDMDLLDLFIGSDGTLGVITRLELRLTAAPEESCGVMIFFHGEEKALRFVAGLREQKEQGIRPAAVEYIDSRSLDLLREVGTRSRSYSFLRELDESWDTAIYTEFYGETRDAIMKKLRAVGDLAVAAGGNDRETWVAPDRNTQREFALLRHAVPELVNEKIAARKKIAPGISKLASDMAVPADRLSAALRLYRDALTQAGLEWASWGHIGDSHIHVNLLPRDEKEYALGKEIISDWARTVTTEWKGTVSAEHGVGKLKRTYLEIMYGREAVEQMRALKSVFDPQQLLNRGNLFD